MENAVDVCKMEFLRNMNCLRGDQPEGLHVVGHRSHCGSPRARCHPQHRGDQRPLRLRKEYLTKYYNQKILFSCSFNENKMLYTNYMINKCYIICNIQSKSKCVLHTEEFCKESNFIWSCSNSLHSEVFGREFTREDLDSLFQLANSAVAKSLTEPQSAFRTAGDGSWSGRGDSGTLFCGQVRRVLEMSERLRR
ncbi:Protein of unknown function [Gryllus bimaculatus]|nr:Protein of unknown function [Gryllus bimaculatus]